MEPFAVYKDIQARTKGQFLLGVVGPVRTGKSTFIRRFMELLALPGMEEQDAAEVRDQLPVSGSGKTITTVEPKFIPREAVNVNLGEEIPVKIRLIDCVGFMVPEATVDMEQEKERMVKTPWYEQEIPFHQAAEIGTRKVIQEHSTIGLVVTCDGSFGDIPRKNFVDGEEKTVQELKKQGKPFLILVNSKKPYGEEAQKLVRELEEKYQAAVLGVNCEQLRKEDVLRILEKILYEFPVRQIEYYIPKWVELLPVTHYLKEDLLKQMKEKMGTMEYIRDIRQENLEMDSNYVKSVTLEEINLSNGVVKVRIQIEDPYYYQVMSEMTGVTIQSGNRWWYRHADGSYTTNGWEVINGAWYYFDGAGWMVTGWVKLSGTWYYLTGSGAMATGWIQTGGTWYYMNTSGAMVTDTWIGNNYVDGSGAWIPGKVKAQAG